MKIVNWNLPESIANIYWKQNLKQFWTEEEFKISQDLSSWAALSPEEQKVYVSVLAGLTGLDTHQGADGMPLILLHTEDLRKKAVLSFMGTMEQIHAKSYSHIFTTLISSEYTSELLENWAPNQKHLIRKVDLIVGYYNRLFTPNPSTYDKYMAHVMSVFLESFLFYSGFYYPTYLAGQGKMTTSGEVIRKIIIDESIHGSFVGYAAQELRQELSEEEREQADIEMYRVLESLFANEVEYTHEIYDAIGIADDVINYVKYNANRALQNLGFKPYFEHSPINPIVENGINTDTKNHDFFSQKGDGYVIALNVEPLTDADFKFPNLTARK
jgi:ribonucleoside-diphosphate reductase beta chain